jgi:crossover junction endodeoxyribonuclease RusA
MEEGRCRTVSLTLPYPPSANTHWRHISTPKGPRVLLSEKGRKFRGEVQEIVHLHGCERLTKFLAVYIDAHPPDRRVRDLDNIFKPLLDSLQHANASWR